jgi:hypothetical protein
MKKVPYTTNRNYKDLGVEEEITEDTPKIKNLKELKKSRFESFKTVIKNIFKK